MVDLNPQPSHLCSDDLTARPCFHKLNDSKNPPNENLCVKIIPFLAFSHIFLQLNVNIFLFYFCPVDHSKSMSKVVSHFFKNLLQYFIFQIFSASIVTLKTSIFEIDSMWPKKNLIGIFPLELLN